MQLYQGVGKRPGASRGQRRALLAVLVLTLLGFLLLFAGSSEKSSLTGTSAERGADAMWARRHAAGKNAAFCASRVVPWLPKSPDAAANVSSIYQLAELLADGTGTSDLAHRVRAVFDVDVDVGTLKVPSAFQEKALQLFPALQGSSDGERLRKLENQPIVTVRNRHTRDMTYFNDIRRFRPGAEAALAREDEAEITRLYTADATLSKCDFCSVARTAEDVFGRREGRHAYTAANIAKLSAWHSLVVARRHNPLDYDTAAIEDMVAQSVAWFEEVARRDPDYRFGNVVCDIGKRASASQVHLHFQVWMTKRQFSSGFAKLHAAARAYEVREDASYWAALVEAHAAAGLVLRVGSAYVFPHLSAAKEKEVVVLEPRRTESFGRAVALVMVALRDEGQARSVSLGMALPFPPSGSEADMPAIFRIIDRGNPLDARGDTGGLEYFTSPYVGTDPYRVRAWLQRAFAQHE